MVLDSLGKYLKVTPHIRTLIMVLARTKQVNTRLLFPEFSILISHVMNFTTEEPMNEIEQTKLFYELQDPR